MKKLILALMLLSTQVFAGMAFFSYETITGMTKNCHYNYLGSTYTITIKSYSICPITINV